MTGGPLLRSMVGRFVSVRFVDVGYAVVVTVGGLEFVDAPVGAVAQAQDDRRQQRRGQGAGQYRYLDVHAGYRVYRHGGGWPGLRALHARVPDLDLSMVLIAIADHTERRVDLLNSLLDEMTSRGLSNSMG